MPPRPGNRPAHGDRLRTMRTADERFADELREWVVVGLLIYALLCIPWALSLIWTAFGWL